MTAGGEPEQRAVREMNPTSFRSWNGSDKDFTRDTGKDAAGSLVTGACLFLAGRRKTALAVAAAGATVGLLEHPEAARELWESLPQYLRKGQDLLVRAEDFINEVSKQAGKLRSTIG